MVCGVWCVVSGSCCAWKGCVASHSGTACGRPSGEIPCVYAYRTLEAWKRAHEAALAIMRGTDLPAHPRARALFEQLRRATISVEANIVEGYALGTPALCRRHLRIAMGSAAEAECLARLAGELEYLPQDLVKRCETILGDTMRALHGLLRNPPVHRV